MSTWNELKARCDDGFSIEIEFLPGPKSIENAETYFQSGMRTVIEGIRIDPLREGDRVEDICVHLKLNPSYHLFKNSLLESRTYYSSARFDFLKDTDDNLSFANAFDDRGRNTLILGFLDRPDVLFKVLDVFKANELGSSLMVESPSLAG
jgi:hypothetical protein